MFHERRAWITIPLAILFVQCSDEDPNSGEGSLEASGGVAGSTLVAGGAFGNGGLPAGSGGAASASGGAAGAPPSGSGGAPPMGSGGTIVSAGGAVASGGAAGAAGSDTSAGGAAGGAAVDGGASGGAGGAGGESGDFSPCPPAGEPCKILPLGDSITWGIGFDGGYRVELFSKALEDGKSITFVGSAMNGPSMVDGTRFPRGNEGHSGWTIAQIGGIVPSPALRDDPHIILLMIGTNDMYMGAPATAPQRFTTLLEEIVTEAPDALIVVAKITPLGFGNATVETYNATLPGIVEESAAAGNHVILVDMYKGFPTTELGDGVHPNPAGYARMAGVWYEAIKDLLH